MKNYKGRKVMVKEIIEDDETEEVILYPSDEEFTVICINCEVDGFGSDYITIQDATGKEYEAIPSYCLELVD